jgi:hypothetical protein
MPGIVGIVPRPDATPHQWVAFEGVRRDDGRMTRTWAAVGPALLTLVATLLVACAGGVGREQAIEIARRESGDAGATVLRAERGPLLRFTLGQTTVDGPPNRDAWAITLAGSYPGECVLDEAGESVCPPVATSKLVVLDGATGAFIFATSPAP